MKFVKYLQSFDVEPVVYTVKNPKYPILDETLEKEIPKNITVLRQPIKEPNNFFSFFKKKKTKQSAGFLDPNPSFIGRIMQYIRANYFIPDASFGLNYYGDRFRLGLSAVNLIETKQDLSSIAVDNTLDRVIYLDGSMKMGLSNKWDLIPSLFSRYMFEAPIVFEGNVRAMYNDLLWVGAGYRLQDAVVFEAGVEFKKFVVGYAYDYTLSDINTISNGTHEILVGYQINVDTSPTTSAWKRRNRIYTNDRK